MITAEEAIRVGRSLLGTPYAELDCINLIKAIIRKASGGNPKYTTAGTNTLWRSRDLVEKQMTLSDPKPGMLAFKASGEDVHHVGLVTGPRTVLHSSSAKGCVVETDLLNGQWVYLARHALIAVREEKMQTDEMRMAVVVTESSPLRLRLAPETGEVIGKIPKGAGVTVLKSGDWPYVEYQGQRGYVSGQYLRMGETASAYDVSVSEVQEEEDVLYPPELIQTTTLMSLDTGNCIVLVGNWRVAVD